MGSDFLSAELWRVNDSCPPTLWVRVDSVDLQIGQQVELLAREGANDPGIFHVKDILYCPRKGAIEFVLAQRGMALPKTFAREDLRPLRVMHKTAQRIFPAPTANFEIPARPGTLECW